MDLARESAIETINALAKLGFNPCFNGSCSRIKQFPDESIDAISFNPCFNGSCSRIGQNFPLFSQKRPEMSPFLGLKFLLENYQTLYKYKKIFHTQIFR